MLSKDMLIKKNLLQIQIGRLEVKTIEKIYHINFFVFFYKKHEWLY